MYSFIWGPWMLSKKYGEYGQTLESSGFISRSPRHGWVYIEVQSQENTAMAIYMLGLYFTYTGVWVE